MIVTCHQPHFLPWIPYFNKLSNSDLFIILDDVAYRKNYFVNRTRTAEVSGRTHWLTVPVKHASLGTSISEILLATASPAMQKSLNRLREEYRDHPKSEFLTTVLSILSNPPIRLIDLNMTLIDITLQVLNIKNLQMVPISKLVDKSPGCDRILTALKEVQATHVIVGMGGMPRANNLAKWKDAGIGLCYQRRQTIIQDSSLSLRDGVSVLHDIVTNGASAAATMVQQFWNMDAT